MALPFGMCWLFTLLLAGFCLSPHKGDIRAYGHFLREHPQITNQLNSGASLNIDHHSVIPRVEPHEAKKLQSHSEDTQNEANSEDDFVVSTSSARLDHQHPFGLLVKEHTQNTGVEGISFPTIRDLKVFINSLKNSYFIPGKDLSGHFQTAQEIMEKERAYNAQTVKNEQSNTYRSNSVKEGSVHDETGENEVWKEPTHITSEQREGHASQQMPAESLSDPVSYASVYENPDSVPALFLRPHLAATDHALSNYEGFANAGIPGKNPKLSTRPPDVDNEDNWSTMHQVFKQIPPPSSQFSDEDSSQRGHVVASPVSPLSKTSQDLHYFSGFHKPSGDFEDHSRSPQKVPLNFLRKSLYTSAPGGNLYILEQPKYSRRPALSVQTHQPTAVYHPVIISSDPQRNYGHMGVKTSSPNEVQNVAFRGNQPVRSHLLTLKPSSYHVSSRRDDQHRGGPVTVTRPSVLAAQLEDYDEKSDLLNQNLIYTNQEPRQRTNKHYTPNLNSSGIHSKWQGLLSPVNEGYLDFNSPTKSALTSDPNEASLGLGSNLMFNHIKTQNNVNGVTPGMYVVNGGRKYFTPSFMPFFIWKRGASANKKPASMAYQLPKLIYASNLPGFSLNRVFWGNEGYIKNTVDPKMSPLPVNIHKIKKRNHYVRGKISSSKTQYTPHFIS